MEKELSKLKELNMRLAAENSQLHTENDELKLKIEEIVNDVTPIVKEIEESKGLFRIFKIVRLALTLVDVLNEKFKK